MSTEIEPIRELDNLALDLCHFRQRPLLILYYDELNGFMLEDDIAVVHNQLRTVGFSREHKMDKLDVLIHTTGGNPHAGYRIAQVIRDSAEHVVFLIPEYAYSAGTLTCMCGNEIRLGDYAVISPFDISVVSDRGERIELISIDYYIEFVKQCRQEIEKVLQGVSPSKSTNVDCELLVEMVKQVKALTVGEFWRARTLTVSYAETLLEDYMLCNLPNRVSLKKRIIEALIITFPTHDFRMDFHICQKIRLPVQEMSVVESNKAKEIIKELNRLTHLNLICKEQEADIELYPITTYKEPFVRLYL
jgi:hypothetical protein